MMPLERHAHSLTAAVRRLLHAPAGSPAEASAQADAYVESRAVLDGLADHAEQSARRVTQENR